MKTRALPLLSLVLVQAASSLGCSVTSGGEMVRVADATSTVVQPARGYDGAAPTGAAHTVVNVVAPINVVAPVNVVAPYEGWAPGPQGGVWKRSGGPVAECPVPEVATPSSCAEVKAVSPGAGDGEYMLSVRGRAVSVHCRGMSGTPTEYLTLRRTGGGANTSRYGEGGNTAPGGLTTSYTRVRFHPDTLLVDWEDATFASSTGWNQFGKTRHAMWGWGNAGDCLGDRSATGTANIDLRGTPFAVAPGQFITSGFHPEGSVHYSARRQVVTLTGGGYCGSTGPTGAHLQLTWLDT